MLLKVSIDPVAAVIIPKFYKLLNSTQNGSETLVHLKQGQMNKHTELVKKQKSYADIMFWLIGMWYVKKLTIKYDVCGHVFHPSRASSPNQSPLERVSTVICSSLAEMC